MEGSKGQGMEEWGGWSVRQKGVDVFSWEGECRRRNERVKDGA